MIRHLNESPAKEQLAVFRNCPLTISVITPSYNQAEFLTECLESVRNQTYKPVEHFVYDPGSKDESQSIATSFSHVTLITELDEGQSDAVNKGFKRASGDIIAWLNSDDLYANPNVFQQVVKRFLEEDNPDIVYGKGIYIDESGKKLRDAYVNKDPGTFAWRFQHEDGILQPALFMRRRVIEQVGFLRNDLHYTMDYEYWIRCMKAGIKFAYIDEDLAFARYHRRNKTYGMRGSSYSEICDIMKEHFGYVSHIWLRRYAEFLIEGYDGVLATSVGRDVKSGSSLERCYRDLLVAYNTSFDTYTELVKNASQKGYGDTYREMKKLGIGLQVPCKDVSSEGQVIRGYTSYVVGSRRWAYESNWKAAQIARSHAFLLERIAKRRSDICIIVGNGPSLNKTNLDLLAGQDVIISNNSFLGEKLIRNATYYTVVNYLVAEQSSHHINRLEGVYKIIPYWLAYCINPSNNTHFVDAVGRAEFCKDIFKNMSWRHTVTFFNLHLAYGLGYKKVVLIGFDHNYKQPPGIAEQQVIHSYEPDENHFDSRYFRGKKWQAADVDKMEEMYRLAKRAYEEEGRTIVNATVGGKLELFPRETLEQAIGCINSGTSVSLGNSISSRNVSVNLEGGTINSEVSLLLEEVEFQRGKRAHLDEAELIAELIFSSVGDYSDGIMIDAGAHFGCSAEPFAFKDWTVYCFEPDPSNRAHLRAKFEGAPNVVIDARALADITDAQRPFFSSSESSGISGLYAFRDTHKQTAVVDVTTVAMIVDQFRLDRIDFLKIDVEGFDFAVLRGVPLDDIRPMVIQCEFEDSKTVPLGHTWKDIADFLVGKGYTVYVSEWHPIIQYGIQHDWCRLFRYPGTLRDPKAWGNLLAFQEDPGTEAIVNALRRCVKVKNASVVERQRETNSSQELLLEKLKRWSGMQYMEFAGWVKKRSLTAFRFGQAAKWSLQVARRHPRTALGLLGALVLLAGAPAYPPMWGYRIFLWSATGLLAVSALAITGVAMANTVIGRLVETQRAEMEARLRVMRRDSESRWTALESKLATIESRLGSLAESLQSEEAQAAKIANELERLTARIETKTSFQRFNRTLAPVHVETLRNVWGERLGLRLTNPALAYCAHRICNIEQNATGRLATSIEDAVLRTLVSSAVKSETLEVLEIGTLFGIGLSMIYEYNRGRFERIHLTAIDPLTGYYGGGEPDVLLNIPISKSVFWLNMQRVGIPRDDVTLINDLSTSEAAIARAGSKKYDLLIIDGDHSYAGVKADYHNYVDLVRAGGYIIFDDCGSTDWPEVKQFVDAEVLTDRRVALVGSEWRTAIFRVAQQTNGD
ncbi:hypothetical protein sS8_1396 [Methylocaldum marinum]|uniref:FkbM family methyltransferase n=1 Tax=Methylocaldum marinum TaxID=1432792 RepID=A0A250KP83_9GAMM|nr:FkbM family methyltransferase [Methylocaldum marinum]BBA33356.1 hypothetical protein sS8_1396 [Methylocaldum marinum]